MDRNEAREFLLTQFKPKEEDLPTPYLSTPDGKTLDGQIKLVGISGKESIELRQKCLIQIFDAQGNAKNDIDQAKLAGLAIIKCVYLKATNEPVFSQLGEADLADLLAIDQGPFNKLGMDVLDFLGLSEKAVEAAKKNSETTQNVSSTSVLPTGSEGPSASSLPQ